MRSLGNHIAQSSTNDCSCSFIDEAMNNDLYNHTLSHILLPVGLIGGWSSRAVLKLKTTILSMKLRTVFSLLSEEGVKLFFVRA